MERGSEFWRFSLSLYRMENVAPSCISLQDGCGLDVNMMLFALWLGSKGRALAAQDLRDADAAVKEWRTQAVIALRGVRRFLREPPASFNADLVAALRDKVKAVELESERLQQESLFALRPVEGWGRPEAPERAGEINMNACADSISARFEAAPRNAILQAYCSLIARPTS
jgi:uncharacterized protein (TIGR02444 family)